MKQRPIRNLLTMRAHHKGEGRREPPTKGLAEPTPEQVADAGALDGTPAILAVDWKAREVKRLSELIMEAARHASSPKPIIESKHTGRPGHKIVLMETLQIFPSARACADALRTSEQSVRRKLEGENVPSLAQYTLMFTRRKYSSSRLRAAV